MDAVVDTLRRAFVNGLGQPVPVEITELEPTELIRLLPEESEPSDGTTVLVPEPETLARLLPGVAVTGAFLVIDGPRVLLLHTTAQVGPRLTDLADALRVATTGLVDTVLRLRAEAAVVDALHSTGRELTAHLDIDEPATVRSDDVVADPRFGRNAPHHGMPEGHLPVRSYLAVSVISPNTGEVLGGFFFGHPKPGQFTRRHEYLAEGIARYPAIALENARLFERERNLASELTRTMLPVVPEVPGMTIVARYRPAATGSKVGGDWFDVIRLPSGGTAFVIGDVVGHGVAGAAVMGQIRTAIRSYAMLDLPPSRLLRNVSKLTENLAELNLTTCFYAVHAPGDNTLCCANAGHLPAVLIEPDGAIQQIGEALAQPLGVGSEFPERRSAFAPGSDLVLYTDGLVECRTRDLTIGIEWLNAALGALRRAPDTAAACDRMIKQLTHGRHDDDTALLHVHHDGVEAA